MLYVVATPIGNLADIGRRAADVLGSVAMIAAEDTRRTRVLLDAIGVHDVRVVALHSHNEGAATRGILKLLRDGADVALVSDAGTPLLSDPGFELVRACWDEGLDVRPVPGASAVLAALSVCPLPCARFHFEGFLPAKPIQRQQRLGELAPLDGAVVFFEAPHRMAECLEDIAQVLPGRRLMVGREMTKLHEQYLCGAPLELLARMRVDEQLRGEFVCVLEAGNAAAGALDVQRTMEILCRELSPAQASRLGAQLLGRGKRELYQIALTLPRQAE